MFISPAYASGAASSSAGLLSFLPMILVFVIMYFFFTRTQQKKDKQHRELMGSLKIGSHVVTQAGLVGTVSKIHDHEIFLEVNDGIHVCCMKSSVARVLDERPKALKGGLSTATPKARSPRAKPNGSAAKKN
jgi:preprotein translocase subunit YajC